MPWLTFKTQWLSSCVNQTAAQTSPQGGCFFPCSANYQRWECEVGIAVAQRGSSRYPGGVWALLAAIPQLCAPQPWSPPPHQDCAAPDTQPALAQVCDTSEIWKARSLHSTALLWTLPGQTILHGTFRIKNNHLHKLTSSIKLIPGLG